MGNQTTGRNELNTPQNFKEFWSFYVGEHINPLTRFIHVAGTTLALILLIATFLSKAWWGLLIAPAVAYAGAWLSHFTIEKNKPATFRYPFWSLLADFLMLYKTFNNTMEAEVAEIKKQKGLKSFALLIFLSATLFQVKAMAQASGETFELMRKTARERYEDFYERQRKQEAWELEKAKGIAELKQDRSVSAVESERARKERVEQRKKEIDEIAPLEPAYLKQQKEDKKKELQIESEYAKRLNQVREYQKKQYPIPEKEEYDLE